MSAKIEAKVSGAAQSAFFVIKSEKIVFWISVAALIFLAMMYIFRYVTFKDTPADISKILKQQQQLEQKIAQLEQKNKIIEAELTNLKNQLRE